MNFYRANFYYVFSKIYYDNSVPTRYHFGLKTQFYFRGKFRLGRDNVFQYSITILSTFVLEEN